MKGSPQNNLQHLVSPEKHTKNRRKKEEENKRTAS
jgi:hypothetical protein